jgi:putative transcriptional regulator
MKKTKRDIGQEILQGIREIKRGKYGRVMTVPSVADIREKTGLSQLRFAELLGVSVRLYKNGSKAGVRRPGRRERFC